MARTGCGGLGLSLLGDNEIVFALGAISSVPLGNDVQAGAPRDLVKEAGAVFEERNPGFRFHEFPIQISIRGRSRIRFRGWEKLENYDIWFEHGCFPGVPGVDECAAIALKGACGAVSAAASAQLLNGRELEMVNW